MKIVVDFGLCQSHGVCMKAAPAVFEVRADNFLYILDENPGEDQRKRVLAAAHGCPTKAITVEG